MALVLDPSLLLYAHPAEEIREYLTADPDQVFVPGTFRSWHVRRNGRQSGVG